MNSLALGALILLSVITVCIIGFIFVGLIELVSIRIKLLRKLEGKDDE